MEKLEIEGIRWSLFGALTFGVLGVSFSLWTNSQAILLDGAFNLVSALTVYAALKISRLLKHPISESRPLGYGALEPLYVTIKGLIILTLTVYVIVSNILILLNGGNDLKLGVILIYLTIAITGNLIVYLNVRRICVKTSSPILDMEKENWLINTLITSSIGVSFLVVFLLKGSFFSPIIPFVDQIVVLQVGFLTIGVPYSSVRRGLRELLLFGADKDMYHKVKCILSNHLDDKSTAWKIYINKLGRKYWVAVYISPKQQLMPIDYGDNLMRNTEKEMTDLLKIYNLDIIITNSLNPIVT